MNLVKPFESRVWLSSPTMHGPELAYVTEAYDTNWMSTVGENIDQVERLARERTGCRHGVALSSGTAALHMAVKLAGVKPGDRVFCSDLTFAATVNPVVYEGDLPVRMNPYDGDGSQPNFWLSCLTINPQAMCRQVRGEREALYVKEKGKTCPTEILETLAAHNAEARPVWKPMHMQPIYRTHGFATREGNGRARSNAYIPGGAVSQKDGLPVDIGADIFERGLCLPSDNKMTVGGAGGGD